MTVPQVLHPFAAPSRQAGDYLEIVRGEGCRLWDSDGRVYLDGTASLWYCAVGHGRREIADAKELPLPTFDAGPRLKDIDQLEREGR